MPNPAERLATVLSDRYRIERELGAGGMATVYLARDLRHDRKVALKVLRPELAAVIGAERFLHEIKTVASLQHPHILPLHDSGEADGLVFYVMPFVEGESLRDRLEREHQLGIDDAVRIAREVADALDYAHRHGVVHRDVKPENILLHDGRAQVADFGIALAVSTASGGTRLTETGMSLGTPHYMAPEQAMGERQITPRADIYALGCVLYEMLVGEPPFTGPTAQAIIARVLTEEPRALTVQRRTVPAELEAVVRKALEKLPADRFASAAEFSRALADPASMPLATRSSTAARAPAVRRDRLARLAVPMTVLALVATGLAAWSFTRPDPAPRVSRYHLALPDSLTPIGLRIAPDGSRLAFAVLDGRGISIWIKERDRAEPVKLVDVTNLRNFVFSPDGRSIAFMEGSTVRRMPVAGGAVVTLGDSAATLFPGLAWLDDGTIVYTKGGGLMLHRVPEGGGPVTRIWEQDSVRIRSLAPLPGGGTLLAVGCETRRCNEPQEIRLLDLETQESRVLIRDATSVRYLTSGHIVFTRPTGALLVVGFDAGAGKLIGEPVPVVTGGPVATTFGGVYAPADDGTLVLRTGAATERANVYQMVWMDRAGRETPVDSGWSFRLTVVGANTGWSVSPDGTRLAIGLNSPAGDDIWIKRLPRGPLSRLTFDSVGEYKPTWHPDGRSVMYGNFGDGGSLYRRNADGTGQPEQVLNRRQVYEGRWSSDGQWLLFRAGGVMGGVGGRNIYGIRPGVDSVPRALLAAPDFDESGIALSPDGRWLVYESNETGITDIFIRPFPEVDSGKEQVSSGGGRSPVWARNGRELFYVNAQREMVAVPVTAPPGAPIRLGEPRVLFRLRDEIYLRPSENYTPFDLHPDGRFLMARRVSEAPEPLTPVLVVENWLAEVAGVQR